MPDIIIIQYTGYILLLITFILFLVFNFIFKWNMVINVLSPLIDKNIDYIEVGLIETKNLKFLETINIIFLIFANIIWYYLLFPPQDIFPFLKKLDLINFITILLVFGPTIMLFISIYKRNMINKLQDARLKGEKNEMKYWLIKSEPSTWSWEDQTREKKTMWDGVRNYQARNNLIKMKKGDLCFFYHSNIGKEIVGIVEVIKTSFIDPSDKNKKFVAIKVKFKNKLKSPVTLENIKKNKDLKDLALIKQSRLSVMPIDTKSWKIILKMSSIDKK